MLLEHIPPPVQSRQNPVRACLLISGFVTSYAKSPAPLILLFVFQASGSWDKTVRVWNPCSGVLVFLLEGHSSWVKSVSFSRDGLLLATAGYSEMVTPAEGASRVLLQYCLS